MKFSEIVSVSGIPGLKRVIGQRSDGLIVSDLDGDNKKFLSSRKYFFSPLESISIYTYEDSVPVLDILLKMKESTPADPKADPKTLRAYMESILPEYDEAKVHIKDITKLIRWFHILQEFDLIQAPKEEDTPAKEEEN